MTDLVPSEPGLRTIQSVDRAAALLKAVAASRDPLSVVELAAQCGLNRSTAWRLLATLDSQGLVERDPVTQRYSVGYAIFQIAAAGDHDAFVRRAHPVLQGLANTTGETANLAVAKRFNLVYVDQVEPPQIMSANVPPPLSFRTRIAHSGVPGATPTTPIELSFAPMIPATCVPWPSASS